MSPKYFTRNRLAQACSIALLAGGIVSFAPQLLAATAAGTQIRNLATVTYQDAAGNVYSAQSNEAIVTVAQVYSATLGVDVDTTAAPGQTVYLPYVLTNTGNGTDTFDLTAVNGIFGGDSTDSSSIVIYNDSNGSGEPDAGEAAITSITLPATVNNTANLVVAVQVPNTATDGQTLGVTLTAEAQQGTGSAVANSVTDLTAGLGRDSTTGTNESLITITGDAVLVATKTVVPLPNNQIAYTITVRNNGNRPANNVVIFDGLPANTTLVSSGVSGLLTTNGDTLDLNAVLDETSLNLDFNGDGDVTDVDEATLGLDLNTDGDSIDTNITGVYAVDAELPPSTSVSLTFTVSYDPAALGGGYVIENTGYAAGDTDENNIPDSLVPSNTTQTVISPSFGVTLSDTGTGALASSNDGGDDDATLNDDQFVDEIAAGGSVIFTQIITNTGNASDAFELSIDPTHNFPAGTTFTFFDSSGTVPLTDSNGSGVDTGQIASGASTTIIVQATVPASASGDAPLPATEYQATVTAVSAGDPAASPTSDTSAISVGTISVATVDIHNASNGTLGADEDPLGAAPYTAVGTFTGTPGSQVTIPLYIDNESGGSDSYVLGTGSSFDGTTLGALPAGWTVEFFVGDGAGNATGSPITATPIIPSGGLDLEIIAVVSIPADGSLALSDIDYDNDGDATDDTLDGNSDGDGDYPIFFQIESLNTGASDITLEAIDVTADRLISLVTPGSNQIEPGGTVVYGHTLANNGNLDEVVELTASNSQAGWSTTVTIDTDGDGIADTALGNLIAGGAITVQQGDGTDIVVLVTDADSDGNPELTLESGFSVPLTATVFAPANAAPGQSDSLTISATNNDPDPLAPSANVSDATTVINGDVRISKTVAVDADCNGTPETAFEPVQTVGVEPDQCVIWRVVAENQGGVDANNVIISDSMPAFSAYEPASLAYCLTNACTPQSVTDAADADEGASVAGNIVFYVGSGSTPASGLGGVLIPGEKATVEFSVRVQ